MSTDNGWAPSVKISASRASADAYCGVSMPVCAHVASRPIARALPTMWPTTFPRDHPVRPDGSARSLDDSLRTVLSRQSVEARNSVRSREVTPGPYDQGRTWEETVGRHG